MISSPMGIQVVLPITGIAEDSFHIANNYRAFALLQVLIRSRNTVDIDVIRAGDIGDAVGLLQNGVGKVV